MATNLFVTYLERLGVLNQSIESLPALCVWGLLAGNHVVVSDLTVHSDLVARDTPALQQPH